MPSQSSHRFVLRDGTLEYRDRAGKLHRDDGPAKISPTGTRTWYRHGRIHRDDGPAIESLLDHPRWYHDGDVAAAPDVVTAWLHTHHPECTDPGVNTALHTFSALWLWPLGATLEDLYQAHSTTNVCREEVCACPARTVAAHVEAHVVSHNTWVALHYDIHGHRHSTEEPLTSPKGSHVWYIHSARATTSDAVDRWLAHHHPYAPTAVREMLHELAKSWTQGDTLTSLHAATLAALA